LANVKGNFEWEEIKVDIPLSLIDNKKGKWKVMEENELFKSKDSITHFKKIMYNKEKDTTLLLCRPITGRTHQVFLKFNFLDQVRLIFKKREHLKHLKYIIINEDIVDQERKVYDVTPRHWMLKMKGDSFDIDRFEFLTPNINSTFIHLHSLKYKLFLNDSKILNFQTDDLPFWIFDNYPNLDISYLFSKE
jgi:hypothetical protein